MSPVATEGAPPAPPAAFAIGLVTLIPALWPNFVAPETGLVGRAFARGLARLHTIDLRHFGRGTHRQVDDTPYGGGAGMVLMAPPLVEAIAAARTQAPGPVVLLGPRGVPLTHRLAHSLSQGPGMVLVCGRYEGIDERVRQHIDLEVSIGDFVLSAGDPAALCLIDATVRLLPGVLGNADSLGEESFADGLLEYPHYTRPAVYGGEGVPEVLKSGDHAAIAAWRRAQARALTRTHRPDLACDTTGACATGRAHVGENSR